MNSTSGEPEPIDSLNNNKLKRLSTIKSGDVSVIGRSLSSEERKRSFKGKYDNNTGVDLTKPMDSKTYSNKSASFSPLSSKDLTRNSGEFAQAQKVQLLSTDVPNLVVAQGTVIKIDVADEVWGTKLGRKFIGVHVDEIFYPEEELIRPYQECREIGDSKGKIIAWQKMYIQCI